MGTFLFLRICWQQPHAIGPLQTRLRRVSLGVVAATRWQSNLLKEAVAIQQSGAIRHATQAAVLSRGLQRLQNEQNELHRSTHFGRALWRCVSNVVKAVGAKGLLDPSLKDVRGFRVQHQRGLHL